MKYKATLEREEGREIDGPVELRAQLASRPEAFVASMTERLLMYAVNRELQYFDMPQVRKVVRNAKKDNYTLASLVLGVVNTDAFRKQGPAVKTAPKVTSNAPAKAPETLPVASAIKASDAPQLSIKGAEAVKPQTR